MLISLVRFRVNHLPVATIRFTCVSPNPLIEGNLGRREDELHYWATCMGEELGHYGELKRMAEDRERRLKAVKQVGGSAQ